jgi:hypothetical protein
MAVSEYPSWSIVNSIDPQQLEEWGIEIEENDKSTD